MKDVLEYITDTDKITKSKDVNHENTKSGCFEIKLLIQPTCWHQHLVNVFVECYAKGAGCSLCRTQAWVSDPEPLTWENASQKVIFYSNVYYIGTYAINRGHVTCLRISFQIFCTLNLPLKSPSSLNTQHE